MRRTMTVTVLLLLTTGCDNATEEVWKGDMLARGWSDLPAAMENKPSYSAEFASRVNCEKGIEALRNQWVNALESRIDFMQFRITVNTRKRGEAMAERNLKLVDGQTSDTDSELQSIQQQISDLDAEYNALESQREAYQTVKDSVNGRCTLIEFREDTLTDNAAPELRAVINSFRSDVQDHRTRASNHLLYLCERSNVIEACKALLQE